MTARPTARPVPPPPTSGGPARAPATGLARDAFGREVKEPAPVANGGTEPPPPKEKAIDALGRRAGALLDELDFTAFVAGLMNGTFDAIVDSSIRQMEAFGELVAAVAKPLDQFMQENVTLNQARDHLVAQYPRDVTLRHGPDGATLVPVPRGGEDDGWAPSPSWLADYGLGGADLTEETLEERLLPQAREALARQRLQTLSSMVLMGMNRVVVRDGTIGAKLNFRAGASERAAMEFATDQDPATGATEWGRRGARSTPEAVTKVSTLKANVQADTQLLALMTGEVRINFASETVPLDRFVDEVRRGQLERHIRAGARPARAALPPPPPPKEGGA